MGADTWAATATFVAAAGPAPDAVSGAGAGDDASICCKRRLGCSAFKGLNLRRRDGRQGDTTAAN